MTTGGGSHPLLVVPGQRGDYTGRSKNGNRAFGKILLLLELLVQGVWLCIAGTRVIGEGEVEPGEEKRPAVLAGVQSFGSAEELKVLVVSPNQKRLLGALQPVLPLL